MMEEGTDDITPGEIPTAAPDKNMEEDISPESPESPMQLSPDQSNVNDNCRTQDNVDVADNQVMEVGGNDVRSPKSPEIEMEDETSHDNESESRNGDAATGLENEPVSSNEAVAESVENSEVKESGGQQVDIDSQNADLSANDIDSNADQEQVSSQSSDLDEEPDSSEVNAETSEGNANIASDNSEVDTDTAKDNANITSVNTETVKDNTNITSESDHINAVANSEIDSNYENNEAGSEVGDQEMEENVDEPNESPTSPPASPEVSSSSMDKFNIENNEPNSSIPDNVSEVSESKECIPDNVSEVGSEIDKNDTIIDKEVVKINEVVTKSVQLAKWCKQGEFVEPVSDIDMLSTMSVKGSVYSEDDFDNVDLDLTKTDDSGSVNITKEADIDKDLDTSVDDDSKCDTDKAAENVSSSSHIEQLQLDNDQQPVSPKSDSDKLNEEKDKSDVSESKDVVNEHVADKKSEGSLEEVSDDEDGELVEGEDEDGGEDGEINDDDDKQSLEEVSSDDDEPILEKEVKKAESGMEEISEEEDISDAASEDGMENVSSEEEEDDHDNDDKNRSENKSVNEKLDETRTVEVKQNGETVTFDDAEKEDGVIVKEILENMTIKIENNSPDETGVCEVPTKRRKSKDKKERRESVKSKSKSTSSTHKDTRDISERLKAQANYGEDVELDYDDTVHDETKDRQGSESEGEIMSDTESSAGEISEEDCEEGEIREPGQKPYVKPTCRFFMRGHCTWGINCRFLHPGVNDKGYYQLIERPGFHNKPPPPFEEKWEEEEPERTPTPEPPPPAPEPKEETAWERGLRQAKELRKKALERREQETNFEHKKMNLSIEENPEYDKENTVEKVIEKSPVKKQPYYDKYEPLSDDEYYDQTPMRLQQKQLEQSWLPGHYENFEVRWTREQYGPPPSHGQAPYPPQQQQQQRYAYHPEQGGRGRERFPLRPSPRRFSPSPPMQRQRYVRSPPREMMRRDKMRGADPRMVSPPPKRAMSPGRAQKADEWNDPWRRSNANKGKSPPKKRSRSRGRRRSRRSFSYSSSYSSSSYSGSSRSRSSSFSSISSRSSRSRSSSVSRSRSPAPRSGGPRRGRGHPPPHSGPHGAPHRGPHGGQHGGPHDGPHSGQPMRRQSNHSQGRPNEPPPRSSVSMRGRPGHDRRMGGRDLGGRDPGGRDPGGRQQGGRDPGGREPGGRGSPMKSMRNQAPPPNKQPPGRNAPPQMGDISRIKKPNPKVLQSQQPQRKFQMAVKTRDRPLPESALTKDKGKPKRRKRSGSSSSSRSSSSSSRSSYSSRSSMSRSRSRSSSSSSSGSADSDHLYRNIGPGGAPGGRPGGGPGGRPGGGPGGRDNQKPMGAGRGKPDMLKHSRPPGDGRGPGRSGMKPTIGETSRPSSLAQAKIIKDPLQMKGLKSNIKLTLIKPNEKAPAGSGQEMPSRKRPPEPGQDAPPSKRPSLSSAPKLDKAVKRPDRQTPISPTKMPSRPPGPVKPALGAPAAPVAKAPAATPGAGAPVVKKKSTVSRREELLKQLQAVEHAIAKKKKKMT